MKPESQTRPGCPNANEKQWQAWNFGQRFREKARSRFLNQIEEYALPGREPS